MAAFIAENMAPIMFCALVFFLLLGYPVAFSLSACGIVFFIVGSPMTLEYPVLGRFRFSGGTHGFVVGHITPEAQTGGLIGLLQDGDEITIDAINNVLEAKLSAEEIDRRRSGWNPPPLKAKSGLLLKYARSVSSASEGCPFARSMM